MKTAIFEIFRTGKHNGSGENAKMQWTEKHLAQIGQFYSEDVKSAPLVIGHPDNDEPKLGKVKRLIHHGGALFAEAQLNDDLIQKIKSGAFSGISASFYPPTYAQNPIKDLGFYLRHVGFLEKGKQNPAVIGMLDPKASVEYLSYSEMKEDLILFCEDESTLSYAEQIHQKALYFSNVLSVNYERALQLINP
ncbi:TPA: hypothetical protein QB611_001988 [Pasteurella multocida]|nr:hypothetical protein [Pasteurella multocida]